MIRERERGSQANQQSRSDFNNIYRQPRQPTLKRLYKDFPQIIQKLKFPYKYSARKPLYKPLFFNPLAFMTLILPFRVKHPNFSNSWFKKMPLFCPASFCNALPCTGLAQRGREGNMKLKNYQGFWTVRQEWPS